MVTMPGMEWTLEIALVVLLAATLFQAVKLERALGVLKRDRASLESLVVHFNTLVRTARPLAQERFAGTADATPAFAADAAGIGSQIERNLLQALRLAR